MNGLSVQQPKILADIHVASDAPGANHVISLLDKVISELGSQGIRTKDELNRATAARALPVFREIAILKEEGREDHELRDLHTRLGKIMRSIWEPLMLGLVWNWLWQISVLLEEPELRYPEIGLSPAEKEMGVAGQTNLVVALCFLARAQNAFYDVRNWPDERRTDFSALGTMASAMKWRAPREAVESMANDLWETDGKHPRSMAKMTETMLEAVEQDPEYFSLKEAPTAATIRKWIKTIAPKDASKPGRPSKKI